MRILIVTPHLLNGSNLSQSLKRHNLHSLIVSPLSLAYHPQIEADALIFPNELIAEQWELMTPFLENLNPRTPLIFLQQENRHFLMKEPNLKFLSQAIFFDSNLPTSQFPNLLKEILEKVPPKPEMQIGELRIDRFSRRVHYQNRFIELSRKEFFLLELFLLNSGRIITRDFIIDYVWDKRDYVSQNTIDVYICRLRKKIQPLTQKPLIRTIPCLGYQLDL